MKPARIAAMYIETSSKDEFIDKCLRYECVETEEELSFLWHVSDEVCERVMD